MSRQHYLSEGVFVNMANLTKARRDSYLEFLRSGVKQDTVTALHTAPLHSHLMFPDQLLVRAEEEVSRERERERERHFSGNSHRKPGRFHPYASSTNKSSHQPDQKSGVPAWKQIRHWQQSKKGRGKASTFIQKPANFKAA